MYPTPKQISFLRTLCAQKGTEFPEDIADMSRHAVSKLIDATIKLANVANAPKPVGLDISGIPDGRYAVEIEGDMKFLKVDNIPTNARSWAGWVFVKHQAGDNFWKGGAQRPNGVYSGPHEAALRAILLDPKGASIRYGQALGVCGVCGRILTDPESIAKGIGPICEAGF